MEVGGWGPGEVGNFFGMLGCVCVTVRVPVAFRNKCERVTGPQPERVRSIFAGVNATRTSGTGPERDRNANRNRCEHGLCGRWPRLVGGLWRETPYRRGTTVEW